MIKWDPIALSSKIEENKTNIFSFSSVVNVSKGANENIQTCEFTSEGRMDVQKAKELLQSANKNFLDIGAYSRAKDVLYLRVSVNNHNLVAL